MLPVARSSACARGQRALLIQWRWGVFLCADGEVDFCLDAYAHVSESAAGLLQRTTTTSSLPLCVESEEGVDFKFSIAPPVMESTTDNTTSRLLARLKKKIIPATSTATEGSS